MLKIQKTFLNNEVNVEKEVFNLFGFEIVSFKPGKKTTRVVATIDNNQDRFSSKLALYKKVSKWSTLPFFPVFIFSGLTIVCVTVLLVLFFTSKNSDMSFIYLLSLGIPACVFLFLTVIYNYFKFRNDLHNLNNSHTLFEIKALVESFEKGENVNER